MKYSDDIVTGAGRFKDLCFCAKNVQVSAGLKIDIKDISPFVDCSTKFYVVTINKTFMKQDTVFTKEFSMKNIAPLMECRTVGIQVQTVGGISTNMILHRSTDRCNLKKGRTDFAANNDIRLQTVSSTSTK
uniref:Uncharacterized protein n=1 Tax=Oryza meridionalis TaxID=40149 RepID=A0A0E0D4B3_9ORYZ